MFSLCTEAPEPLWKAGRGHKEKQELPQLQTTWKKRSRHILHWDAHLLWKKSKYAAVKTWMFMEWETDPCLGWKLFTADSETAPLLCSLTYCKLLLNEAELTHLHCSEGAVITLLETHCNKSLITSSVCGSVFCLTGYKPYWSELVPYNYFMFKRFI